MLNAFPAETSIFGLREPYAPVDQTTEARLSDAIGTEDERSESAVSRMTSLINRVVGRKKEPETEAAALGPPEPSIARERLHRFLQTDKGAISIDTDPPASNDPTEDNEATEDNDATRDDQAP